MDLSSPLGAVPLQQGGPSVEEWLRLGTLVLARVAEGIGALVVAAGVAGAFVSWVGLHLLGRNRGVPTESIRLELGRTLGLALKFLLAADIRGALLGCHGQAGGDRHHTDAPELLSGAGAGR